MHRPALRLLGFLVLVAPVVARAAPPAVQALVPSGGQRGTTVTVTVTGNVGTPPASVWSSRSELKIEPDKDAGKYLVTIPPDSVPGAAWLRWHNAEGASNLKTFMIGKVPELAEKEPNNELTNATPVESLPVVANGVLEKNGEVDVFAVTLKKGQTLVAAVDANRTLGSPMDAVVQIVSPKGFVLEQNDDGPGYDPLAAAVAPADGVHYVRVFAFPTEPNTNVALHGGPDYVYRLTLSAGPYATHALPLTMSRGSPQPLKLHGWNFPMPTEAPGAAILTVPGEDTDAVLVADSLTNLLPLRVVDHPTLVEAEPATAAAPMKIAVPATITGVVGKAKEIDVFAFQATKGQRIVFRAEARSIGSLLDPFLRIADATGKTLVENDDNPKVAPDAEVVWAAPADGEYRAEVRDLYEDGGPRYFYRLTLRPETPGVALTVAADQFTLPKDKPLEIPVTIERTAGFAAELEVTIAGLPEGLNVVAVKSVAADATGKMVKLVVERKTGDAAKPLPPGAPIRITAQAAAPPAGTPAVHHAEGPVAGRKATTTRELWLTIAP